jgi:hypothetical protein
MSEQALGEAASFPYATHLNVLIPQLETAEARVRFGSRNYAAEPDDIVRSGGAGWCLQRESAQPNRSNS